MTNDAKLGMLAGVAAVVVVAVVYFQKPQATGAVPGRTAAVGNTTSPPSVPPAAVIVPGKAADASR